VSLKVLISGAGIGGLALAQGLRRSGVSFEVFERDSAVDSRAQGYRIRMDADGDKALRTCLPPDLYNLYQATSCIPATPPTGTFNENLELTYRFPVPPATPSAAASTANPPTSPGPAAHVTVNRHTLRQLLLTDLGDAVHFGATAINVVQDRKSVRVDFANRTSATGDILVAAEGINSPLRQRFLPNAQILDLGMTCIYGRVPLTPDLFASLPETLHAGFTPILGPNRRTMGVGSFRKRMPFADAAGRFAPRAILDPVGDYMMWILVAPRTDVEQATGHSDSPSPAQLHGTAVAFTSGWHPALRRLLTLADINATFAIPIQSSQRVPPWPSSRITFLGDAIHAMTPAGGIGANTALRDAELLSYSLAHADTNSISLDHAIETYEAAMREYAFLSVERSLTSAGYLYQLAQPSRQGA
jgi:2-polyprenyl-6-methoxyphenol hydroxylase-like FAD-dependent oxidoreductase